MKLRRHPMKLRELRKPRKPTGYVFTDEMWRTRTEYNRRLLVVYGKPRLAEKKYPPGMPEIPPRTAAERACAEDEKLWESSSTPDDYEERKRALYERRRVEREEWMEQQPTLHAFPSLPPELRLYIWRYAMEEPTEVQLTVTKYKYRPELSWVMERCAHRAVDLQAIAPLPPLILVNHESNALASAHYKRAFRGVRGTGGVLTAYPTILRANSDRDFRDALWELPADDYEVGLANVKKIVFESVGWWGLGPLGTPRPILDLRSLVEAKWPVSALELIEFEITMKDPNKESPEGSYYFRGSFCDLPS